jgi:hypothetical protein
MRAASLTLTLLFVAPMAYADEPPPAPSPSEAHIDLTKDTKVAGGEEAAPLEEPPPPPPYKKTLVLDASVGALGFLGQFGKVAPPAPWMHVQLGYEFFRWFMVYGEGELAFTDTSKKLDPPNTRAFPLYGFGGGARFTIPFTDRFGIYAQGGVGMLKADVPQNALGIIGFHNAESFGAYIGGRLGVEWFQVDRHFALGANAGIRLAQGFAQTGAGTDTPLALDGGVSLRYAF